MFKMLKLRRSIELIYW